MQRETITRAMLEDNETCGRLVEAKLNDIGIDGEGIRGEESRAATKDYCTRVLKGWLEIEAGDDFADYYFSIDGEVGAFEEGYLACLEKHLVFQTV